MAPRLTALAYHPFAPGIGLGEDTAAFIVSNDTVHLEGSGGITVVDAAEVQFSSMDSVNEGRPVALGLGTHHQRAGEALGPGVQLGCAQLLSWLPVGGVAA